MFYHGWSSVSYGSGFSAPKFTSTHSSQSDYRLIVSNVDVDDSAVYYCQTYDSSVNVSQWFTAWQKPPHCSHSLLLLDNRWKQHYFTSQIHDELIKNDSSWEYSATSLVICFVIKYISYIFFNQQLQIGQKLRYNILVCATLQVFYCCTVCYYVVRDWILNTLVYWWRTLKQTHGMFCLLRSTKGEI